MTCATNSLTASAAAGVTAYARVTRVENGRLNSGLADARTPLRAVERRADAPGERANPSRFETNGFDPLWHGPRLRAPFVAQVLGQMLAGEAKGAPSGFEMYRRGGVVVRGRLLDGEA
jgi:hypothetical protein